MIRIFSFKSRIFFLLFCSVTFALMNSKVIYCLWLGDLCEGESPSLKSHGPLLMLNFTYDVSLAMEEFSLRYSFHIPDKSVVSFHICLCVCFCFTVLF